MAKKNKKKAKKKKVSKEKPDHLIQEPATHSLSVEVSSVANFNLIALGHGLSDSADMVEKKFGNSRKVRFGEPCGFVDFLLRDNEGRIRTVDVNVEKLRQWVLEQSPWTDGNPWAYPPE